MKLITTAAVAEPPAGDTPQSEVVQRWQKLRSPLTFEDVKLKPFSRVLERVAEMEVGKEDIVVPFSDIQFVSETNAIEIKSYGRVLVTEHAFGQFCARLKIPADYMTRCPLVLRNANLAYWVEQNDERKVLLRIRKFPVEQQDTEGLGILRAVLPQTYEPIDNLRIIDWVASAITYSNHTLGVQSARISENSTHIRLLFPEYQDLSDTEIEASNKFYFGVHISDSEVGDRGFFADLVTFRPAHGVGFLHTVDGNHLVTQRHIHIDFKMLRRSFAECFAAARENFEPVMTLLQEAEATDVRDPHTYIRRLVRHYRLTNDFAETVIVAYEAEPRPTRYGIALALGRAAKRMETDMRVDTEALVGAYLLEGA